MARPVIAAAAPLLALALAGCFRAPVASPQRTLDAWRSMRSSAALAGDDAGDGAGGRAAAGAPLGPDEAYALALENNPDLAAIDARAAVARAEIAAARQVDNPSLRVSNFDLQDAAQGFRGITLGLRTPVPRPASVRARVIGARLGAEDAEAQAEAARRRLRARIFHLYARLAWLRADLAEVERAVALYDQRRRELLVRVEAAVATEIELGLAEVAHAEALDEAARLRGELTRGGAELARLVDPSGRPRRFAIDDDALAAPPLDLDEDALTERALRARPELRAAQSRVGQAQAAVHLGRSEAAPWVSWAQVNYYAGAPGSGPPIGFGLALDLPLYSGNRGKIRAAKAEVRRRTLEERAAIATVAGEVADAVDRLRQADARVRALEEDLLPRVDAAADKADAALGAGVFDVVKLLDIEARRIAARRLHLAALHQRRAAIIELEAAIGAPLVR